MINNVSKTITTTTKTNITATTTMAINDLRQTPQEQQQQEQIDESTITATTTIELDNCEGGENRGRLPLRQLTQEDDEFPAASVAATTHTFVINPKRRDDDRDCKQTTTLDDDEASLTIPRVSSKHCRRQNVSSTSGGGGDGGLKAQQTKTNEHSDDAKGEGEPLLRSTTVNELLSLSSLTVKPSPSVVVLQNQAATLTHKNITNVPCEVSYHRTLETETSPINCGKIRQCELLESTEKTDQKFTDHQTDYQTTHIQSLAERKALLKKEFFKDFPSSSPADYTSGSTVKPALSKRLLRKQHNLKLKISPKPYTKNLQTEQKLSTGSGIRLKLSKLDSKPNSLVALRKLDLQRQAENSHSNEVLLNVLETNNFPSVKDLARRFDNNPKMIVPQTKLNSSKEMDIVSLKPAENMNQRNSPLSDEGCNLGQSPYSSDDDNDSIRTTHTAIERLPSKRKDKVARSASSDSALGLDVDESMDTSEPAQPPAQQQKRRMTLTVTDLPLRPALLPLAEPTLLPDSPPVDILTNINISQTQIPTKVLLEERVVEIPEDPRSGGSSRRESSQSCLSDYPANDMQGVRFVRTPSVVVSDYSDDIMCGITLEEIEYFRAQRMRRRRSSLETAGTEKDALDNNSDVSAASSCSNLYYCGSTISALDGAECLVNGMRMQLERKTSDCSTCSVSGDEDSSQNFTIPEQPEDCQDLSDMLANQHLSCKRSKKVGGNTTAGLLTVDHTYIP